MRGGEEEIGWQWVDGGRRKAARRELENNLREYEDRAVALIWFRGGYKTVPRM